MMGRDSYDTIIIGGGAMGAAAAWQLSSRGRRALVLDRFRPPHTLGSTHGETRVIREAYFEHPAYVPLVQRAYQLWRELEGVTGRSLLRITGGLMIGPAGGEVFSGAKASADLHRLPHEILDAATVCLRFPALRVPEHLQAVLEPRAGMLFVEACVEAFLAVASQNGTALRFDEPVTGWQASDSGVEVTTGRGRYRADRLVIAAGAWLAQLVPDLAKRLRIERQVLHWFRPERNGAACLPERLPVHVVEYEPRCYYYALPDAGNGVKAAFHHQGDMVSADTVCREVNDAERQRLAAVVGRFLPLLSASPHQSVTCLYTNTPDERFVLDHHPAHANVLIASPCSGHGFKFASAIGELAADWATESTSRFDLSLFRLGRFDCR